MKNLQDLSYSEITMLTASMGMPAFRASQIYQMSMQHKDYDEVTNLPTKLKDELSKEYYATALTIIRTNVAKDCTKKYLYKLRDGNIIEGVYMVHSYGNTLCVSTQVGCRMGCAFCASGIGGLVRHLSAGEILAQVLAANKDNGGTLINRAVTNIVIMGSGEPLDNYDNVVKFLDMVSFEKGINISLRNVSLSTVGLPNRIRELADAGISLTLSVSLHAPTDEKRTRLIPLNLKYNIADIISATKYYFDKTKRRITFEYALVAGENSDETSAKELVDLVKGLPCHINLIPLNYVKEKGLHSANKDMVQSFLDILTKNNISATIRRSMGDEVDGACGQLRNKFMQDGIA